MIPCRETEHVAKGLALLTTAYRGKPVIEAILSSYLRQIQEIEDAAWQVIYARMIGETSTVIPLVDSGCCECTDGTTEGAEDVTIILDGAGVCLDPIGRLVGEPRNGREDPDFLIAIKCRIRANRAQGRAEDILQILRLAVPTTIAVTYSEPGEASWLAEVYGFEGVRALAAILDYARSGGVRGTLQFSSLSLDESFRFAWEGGASAGDTRGPEWDTPSSYVSRFVGSIEV